MTDVANAWIGKPAGMPGLFIQARPDGIELCRMADQAKNSTGYLLLPLQQKAKALAERSGLLHIVSHFRITPMHQKLYQTIMEARGAHPGR